MLTGLFAILFYAATAILVVGVANRIAAYWRTPAPLKIPTMPAPRTQGGMVYRMGREVVLFESLFRSNKWIWIFGWMFHMALFLVLLRHGRYFQESPWFLTEVVQPFGKYGGFAMIAGLAGLWGRRFLVERIRYISTPSDHLMLILLLGIGISGMMMTMVAHTDIVALKHFMIGLMVFDWKPLPADPVLIAHLSLVIILMVIFPISKLMHAPGIFFSPTRNQIDDSREKRHIAPWAAEMEK
ncbi:MAG: nitrate reductase [Gammaproteobacteria bacterium]|jgi:nitrate reductase gamma subunit|nr:nitrate reductase [Gammaproteobacteria bacterium]MBT4605887.1 nitrate reductase [Thiotrichales bacterium]MBT3471597.1 nitrate reductase [Gammaproteobacteria bacterium]MBT3967655.1 nitrate reductase [Gammaproteobacteria bacterium]MBT4081089.1 nitrate reductase [Gammaproteobacteria bacterium]